MEATEGEDLIRLPGSSNSGDGSEEGELAVSDSRTGVREDNPEGCKEGDGVKLGLGETDVGTEEGEFNVEAQIEVDMDLVDSPIRPMNIHVADTLVVEENISSSSFGVNVETDAVDRRSESVIHRNVDARVSGVKRKRTTYDVEQPSVHVSFNSLTRASTQKLQELLQQWSEWHAQHGSSSQDLNEVLESGEETYFPALCIGLDKPSSVSFWIENQRRKEQDDCFVPLDGNSVPLYDRGYALGLISADGPSNAEGGLEIVNDAARCFNCGSYSHSLRECPKPRDNAAVNIARKQHKAKKNQSIGSRRYYQNSSGGKYDGLKPGALDVETRKLLGIGDLDPPPWLKRMRELGYPPGYLDPDDDDQPSGITIFADEDVNEEQQEDGEIVETENSEPPRKKTVEFPGINAPVPENADERLWVAGPSSSEPFGSRSHRKVHQSSESISRRYNQERRLSREYMDDGPPGVGSPFSPSSYPPRYGNYDSSRRFESPRDSPHTLSRSHSERGRSALMYEDYVSHSSSPYSSWSKRSSPHDYGSARSTRSGNETDESRDDYDQYHHRSRW